MNPSPSVISALDIERIKTDSFVRTIEFHQQLPSTNDLALERAAVTELNTPLLVVAGFQTAGRGRGSNQWWAAAGALTFSLVIDIGNLEPTGACDPRISATTALSVHDCLWDLVPRGVVQLKWPNDVYIDSRKVAGVLLERPATRPERLVIGIGINVNNSLRGAPEQIQDVATSLVDASGACHAPGDVLRTTLRRFASRYRELADDELRLAEQWRAHCMLRNHTVRITAENRVTTGVCHGIDDRGALVVEAGSTFLCLHSGTVDRIKRGVRSLA